MPILAELITDSRRQMGEPPVLRYGRQGWSGSRHYLVNTHEERLALLAAPAYGAAWDNDLPNLKVVSKETDYRARKDGTDGTGGLTLVRCDYAEPEMAGFLPPPFAGLAFTELGRADETQTVYFDLDAPSVPGSPPAPVSWPLANGDGFAKRLGRVTARVYVYLQINSFPDITRLARLMRGKKVNSDAVTLPRVLGTSVVLNVGPGQVQYEGFTHQMVGGGVGGQGALLEFVHEVSLAPDFKERWRVEDEEGNADGPVIVSRIYEEEPFAGLWP